MASKNEGGIYVPNSEIVVPEVYLTELRMKKIFSDLPFSKSDRKGRGLIWITCSDGHVFPEILIFLYKFFEYIHVIADNGAPFFLIIKSRRKRMMDSIKKAYEFKGFTNFFVSNHSFCSGAKMYEFNTQKTISATLDASAIMEDNLDIGGINVLPGYSIDYRKFNTEYLGKRKPRVLTYELSPQNIYAPTHGLLK